MYQSWSYLPVFLLFIIFELSVFARLTHNGVPYGQTMAPTGRDYLSHRPPQQSLQPSSSRHRPRQKNKQKQKNMRSSSTKPHRKICLSSEAPFHTLRNTACLLTLYTPRLISTNLPATPIRAVTSSQLSTIFQAAASPPLGGPSEPVIVLFHGGPSCPWSPSILEAWLHAQQVYRNLCLVSMDAAADSMLNYNLMVLAFPTIMRIRADKPVETFRANRTSENLIAWIYRVTNIPPMSEYVPEHIFIGLPAATADLVTFSDSPHTPQLRNWPLWGANIVTVLNVIWFVFKAIAAVRRFFTQKPIHPHAPPVPPASPIVEDHRNAIG